MSSRNSDDEPFESLSVLLHRFHDVDGIADFLILKQHYDQAIRHEWHIGTVLIVHLCAHRRCHSVLGNRFRCFIDDAWWPGTIIKRESFDLLHENSPFQCYIIRWDNGESEERLSPWDLFEYNDLRMREILDLAASRLCLSLSLECSVRIQ